jgi:hypothetical protein
MDLSKASMMKRPPIQVGECYPFYSTLEGVDGYGVQCRQYTGQHVLVVEDTTDYEGEGYAETQESIFKVRAEDGVEFSAWEGELNDWFFDTRQYYTPEGVFQR